MLFLSIVWFSSFLYVIKYLKHSSISTIEWTLKQLTLSTKAEIVRKCYGQHSQLHFALIFSGIWRHWQPDASKDQAHKMLSSLCLCNRSSILS